MSECKDKRLKKMLHAYELGILSEAETSEFEQHLMDCEDCFASARQFDKTARHLRFSPGIRQEMSASDTDTTLVTPLRKEHDSSSDTKKRWPGYWITPLVAAAVLIIMVLKPW